MSNTIHRFVCILVSIFLSDLVSIFGNFSDTMTVVPYQSLTLHCEVSDLSTSVSWRKSNGQLPAGVLVSGNNIIFTSVSADNVGVYQCVANTSVGVVTKDVSIKVRGKAMLYLIIRTRIKNRRSLFYRQLSFNPF